MASRSGRVIHGHTRLILIWTTVNMTAQPLLICEGRRKIFLFIRIGSRHPLFPLKKGRLSPNFLNSPTLCRRDSKHSISNLKCEPFNSPVFPLSDLAGHFLLLRIIRLDFQIIFPFHIPLLLDELFPLAFQILDLRFKLNHHWRIRMTWTFTQDLFSR